MYPKLQVHLLSRQEANRGQLNEWQITETKKYVIEHFLILQVFYLTLCIIFQSVVTFTTTTSLDETNFTGAFVISTNCIGFTLTVYTFDYKNKK